MSNRLESVREHRYLTLNEAAMFHGHTGPFLVIGYRLGEYAVKQLSPIDEFDLVTTVYIPLKTPFSCILDGLQCSTKCTLGKWNIKWIDSDEFIIKFLCLSKNKGLIMEIKHNIIEAALNCKDISEIAMKLTKISVEDIANIQEI